MDMRLLLLLCLNCINDLAGKQNIFGDIRFKMAGGDLATCTDPDGGEHTLVFSCFAVEMETQSQSAASLEDRNGGTGCSISCSLGSERMDPVTLCLRTLVGLRDSASALLVVS